MTCYDTWESPLGTILLTSDGERLTGLTFQEAPGPVQELPVFKTAKRWLTLYFQGREPDFLPAISLSGTPFQMLVWRLLTEIPWGETVTYGSLAQAAARELGVKAMSPQAIGGAVGRNPVSILVPCHRVVGANGSLTGYAWGTERKKALLELEAAPEFTVL